MRVHRRTCGLSLPRLTIIGPLYLARRPDASRDSSRLASVAHHQACRRKAMTGDRAEKLLAIEARRQRVRHEVQREDIEYVMMRRIDRRAATRAAIAHCSARILAADDIS